MMILEKNCKIVLQKKEVSLDVLNTLLNIADAKGLSFSSELEIANYINKEYDLNVSSDDVAKLFELRRCEEDSYLTYKNYLGI